MIENKQKVKAIQRFIAVFVACAFVLTLLLTIFSFTPVASAAGVGSGTISSTREDGPQILAQSAAVFRGQADSLLNITAQDGQLRLAGDDLAAPRWAGNWLTFGLADSQTLRYSYAFNSVKANWQAATPAGTAVEFDVRASQDGDNWTLWETLTNSGQTAQFEQSRAYLYMQYRVRLFTNTSGLTPAFSGVTLEANRRNLDTVSRFYISNQSAQTAPPPAYKVYGTRQGMVGGTTANGHVITPRDRFVSLPSWKSLNGKDKRDYQVKITVPSTGRSGVAPVWDVGPWSHRDDYWNSPRERWNDLPLGTPMAEKAYYEKYNDGKNEFGEKILNPSSIDIGDGTYWDDLGLAGATFQEKLEVTFLWKGTIPGPAAISDVKVTDIGSGTAVIRWKTNLPTTDWIEYSFDSSYGFKSNQNNALTTDHIFPLKDLVPNKTYNFRVRGRDVYGTETASGNFTFKTGEGQVAPLTAYQTDKGIGVTISPKFDGVLVAGGRVNSTLWSDNPVDDYSAGAVTTAGGTRNIGALDVDFNPVCDDKGQNCAFGFGSGYKTFVQFRNAAGDWLSYGLIQTGGISPNAATLMVEGKVGGVDIQKYYTPDMLATNRGYHFQFVWQNGKMNATFEYTAKFDSYNFNLDGLVITFGGSARYKDDVVAVNFQNIAFAFGTVLTPS